MEKLELTDELRAIGKEMGFKDDAAIRAAKATMNTLNTLISEEVINAHKALTTLGCNHGGATTIVIEQLQVTTKSLTEAAEDACLLWKLLNILKSKKD